MVVYLEQGADLHMAQLMPLPLTVYCFSKFQIGFTFLVPAHPGSPEQWAGPLSGSGFKVTVGVFLSLYGILFSSVAVSSVIVKTSCNKTKTAEFSYITSSSNMIVLAPFALSDPSESPRARP